jgi:AcrR family transcriptional regulator
MTAKGSDAAPRRVRGAQRTTREDWIAAAMDLLVEHGIEQVKVAPLAEKLGCARSSFYWYFSNRRTLLDELLEHWRTTNTEAIIRSAGAAAENINDALINVLACWSRTGLPGVKRFDTRLDFAIRDWARKDEAVRRLLDMSDTARIAALQGMFERFGYEPAEARIRARIVYFTQIGYEVLDTRETRLDRAETGPYYLYCHTGVRPTQREIDRIVALARPDAARRRRPE